MNRYITPLPDVCQVREENLMSVSIECIVCGEKFIKDEPQDDYVCAECWEAGWYNAWGEEE